MKKLITIVVIATIIFLGLTGGTVIVKEYIPGNAKIFVIEENRIWIPNAPWTNEIFEEQASKDYKTKRSFDNIIESTYSEIQTGRYKGYELPELWKKEEYKQRIFWGKDQSLLRSWVMPKEKRWKKELVNLSFLLSKSFLLSNTCPTLQDQSWA